MSDLRLRDAVRSDLDRLVSMNAELIEDEAYDTPLSREELEVRWSGFLSNQFRVFIFLSDRSDDEIVGYAVLDTSRQPVYLRQFFIARNNRRRGYGRIAFARICETIAVDRLDVEVMAWNDVGKKFWRSLGFVHRYEGLRWTP